MTETSEEEESEKRRDEDELNGYDEETMSDGIDKSWEGLQKRTPEGDVEEEDGESDQRSQVRAGRGMRKDKNRVRMYDYFVNF